jgi:2-isopropylmalate synthase
MDERVYIFDTTLRDGEQSPGASLNPDQKLAIAKQLALLGVDVIEAGFPLSSPGDFEAVQRIARQVEGPMITALARAARPDIDAVWQAVKEAPRHQIHMVLSVSDIHIERKLRSNRRDVLRRGADAVAYVEYSPEDAGRADPEYLFETLEAVIEAGATVVNIPDTTGYTLPNEFGALIAAIRANVRNIDEALISVHCHNDLGLSTANSVAAVLNGARRVECTINGIGERAGNASLEEVVMILRTRERSLGLRTGIDTTRLAEVSALVSRQTGVPVQPNKAVVGANAFAHASGIHQDGILKDKTTYEIMRPEDVGMGESRIVLSPRSGRHAFQFKLAELGYHLPEAAFSRAWEQFLQLADRKKDILDRDLEDIVRSTQSLAVASPPPLGEGRVGAVR